MNLIFSTILCCMSIHLLVTAGSNSPMEEVKDPRKLSSVVSKAQGLPEEVINFCPNSVFCPRDVHQNKSENNNCCIPCDCSSTCQVTRTCCPEINNLQTDVFSSDMQTDHGETCVKTYVGNLKVKPGVVDINTFLMIQSCKSDYENSTETDTVMKCLQPDENIFKEFSPVYSKPSRKTYRNIYCARCNDDATDTVQWESHVACTTFAAAMTSLPQSDEGNYLIPTFRNSSRCVLQLRPIYETKHCVDALDLISECPGTGPVDTDLETLCPQVYAPTKGGAGIYKNVYCLKCNERATESRLTRMCYFGYITISNLNLFSTILGPGAYLGEQVRSAEETMTKCRRSLTYDTILENCVLKSCAITEIKIGQECIFVFRKIKTISLDYRLKVLAPFKSFTLQTYDKVLATFRSVVIHDTVSEICEHRMISAKVEGDFMAIRFQLIILDNNAQRDLHEDLDILEREIRNHNKQVAEGKAQYPVELDTSEFKPIPAGHPNIAVYKDYEWTYRCGNAVAMSYMQLCKTVQIKTYDVLNGGIVRVNNASFLPGEYIPQEKVGNRKPDVYICYDLYVSKLVAKRKSPTNVAPIHDKVDIAITVFFTVYIYCYL